MTDKENIKIAFEKSLQSFVTTLKDYVSTPDNQWTIKGFVDVFENIYTISADTKIVSKILEIHLFSKFLTFANENDFELIWAEKQNWYPDLSFVSKKNNAIKFAVDLKTTYRLEENPAFCNGFTLGSHGEYFSNRDSHKNIQFPYNQYLGHYCLGLLYSRKALSYLEESKVSTLSQLKDIPLVISDFEFFAQEKWKIASDKSGSGNTANVGSINFIEDIVNGNGVFAKLGEKWFDEYWKNYGKITIQKQKEIKNADNQIDTKIFDSKITDIKTYLQFKGKEEPWINQYLNIKKTAANMKGGSND
jgi:Restriction endonuclease EcoRV